MNKAIAAKPLAAWIQATRPKTLPTSIAPVVLASALAYRYNTFKLTPALLCLGFALMAQIIANYANDYFDYLKGADTARRKGPQRVVASGLVSPRSMKAALILSVLGAFFLGLFLIQYGGWWLVGVGIASLVSAMIYTAGPYPLGYHGLGDFFVFIFFGLIAVMFTFYVQANYFNWESFWFGTSYGLLSVNLLAITSYRDIDTDREVGKRTLAVRYGGAFVQAQYIFNFTMVVAITLMLYFGDGPEFNVAILLPLALVGPVFALMSHVYKKREQASFDAGLKTTVAILVLYTLFTSYALILTR